MINYITYPFKAIASILVTVVALIVAPVLPLFARDGLLPNWLKWFQTPDNSLYGDWGWKTEHHPEDYKTHMSMTKWLWRNPAQGFDQLLKANITLLEEYNVLGNIKVQETQGIGGVLFIHGAGYFHLYIIIPLGKKCIHSEFGWRLRGIVEGYPSEICKQFVFTPFRVFKFGK